MSNYNPYTPPPRIISSSRYLPKLTTITETPLSKRRLAILSRVGSPKAYSSHIPHKYVPPRPRQIDTSEIDVSADRYRNRRNRENEVIEEKAEPTNALQKEESVDDIPGKGRSTIRRDRALVRLRTVRLRSRSPSPKIEEKVEPKEEIKLEEIKVEEKINDIDPGYGSSERSSSGSWRNNFEGELDLYEKKVTSPTAKTPGENFFEKYHIRDVESINTHYLTMEDVPAERRDSVRRRSNGKLPSFKEICSDISSDKIDDDLNAGELRRRASLIIEEEINKIRKTESGTMLCLLEQQVADLEDCDSDKRKSRKVKKLRQKITAKTSIENSEPKSQIKAVISVEIEEKQFSPLQIGDTDEVSNKTFKLPLRKKKKLTDVDAKITCDPIVSPTTLNDSAQTVTPKENIVGEAKCAEIKTNEKDDSKTHEAVVNIKTKSVDLDSKLLLDKDEVKVNEAPGESKKLKKIVKSKPLEKAEVETAPKKMIPIQKDVSVDDFWGMLNSRETAVFSKRKQQVNDDKRKTIFGWSEEADDKSTSPTDASERKSVLKNKPTSLDKIKTTAAEAPKKIEPPGVNEKVQTSKIDSAIATDRGKLTIEKVLEKSENDLSSSETKAEKIEPKLTEPKVDQKLEENAAKINKLEKSTADAPKADKVSNAKPEEKASENKKINEKVSPKQMVTNTKEEAPLKLQAVPKPSNLNLAKIIDSSDLPEDKNLSPKSPPWKSPKKISGKPQETPKSPPWKIQSRVEEKTPESPKSPPWKLTKKVEDELPETPKTPPSKLENKTEEKLPDTPKSPPWKLPKKVDEKLPESPKSPPWKLQSKAEPKIPETPKGHPWKVLKKVEEKVSPTVETLKKESNMTDIKDEAKVEPPKSPAKKLSLKNKEKIPDTKDDELIKSSKPPANKTSDQKMPPDNKSTPTVILDDVKKESDTNVKSLAADQSPKASLDSQKVNEQVGVVSVKKKKASVRSEGQKLETEEAKVLNETKNTQAELLNTDEPTLVNSNSKKTLGKLSKFPTLNNLNSISVNEAIADNQQQHTDQSNICDTIENKTIDSQASQIDEQISVASESPKASTPPTTEAPSKEEPESESESSSYEDDSEESSDEMEKKKDFNPQKKVKLDFTQMRKCYGGKDEKPLVTLTARPRPLWKIKRNRHAVFSESETESSAEEETRSTAGDSAGSSQSSTKSEKNKKKSKGKGEDENITALMSTLSVQEEQNGEESEAKKKNRLSTSSQDSGFCGIGATAAKSPRKAMGEFKAKAFNSTRSNYKSRDSCESMPKIFHISNDSLWLSRVYTFRGCLKALFSISIEDARDIQKD